MITQREIIDRLNQLTLRYNLTWFDIKYDADKAIAKINSFLGANYPKMSVHLKTPESTYTVNAGGVDHEIFPEEYIHSVVIPFIAMEVLARDEEFTTIYNKYSAELEDGLFNMFQREFNRVPFVFRQDSDRGVFFDRPNKYAKDHVGFAELTGVLNPLGQELPEVVFHDRHSKDNLPEFKFRIYYHTNNADIISTAGIPSRFVEDTYAYLYGDTATIKGWDVALLSLDGTRAYTFAGWTRGRSQVTENIISEGDKITMKSDVHLYAKWTMESTMSITPQGELSLKDKYKTSLISLAIPDYVNNIPVKKIASNFVTGAGYLDVIMLPKYVDEIKPHAFKGYNGSSIIFYEGLDISKDIKLTIGTNAFAETPKLENIIIPEHVVAIDKHTFPVVERKSLTIYCRVLQQNKPEGWVDGWYSDSVPELYNVTVEWGYNG